MSEKQFKELREARSETKEFRERLQARMEEINQLRAENKVHCQNITHLEQTIRSLHWALNVATGQIRKLQEKHMEFKYDEKSHDWVALAE